MFTTNECVIRKCPALPFNCCYRFSTKVSIWRNSETKIKRFIMFLDYSKLHVKFLKYQLLIYSPVKKYWFPRWFFWFFWLAFLAIITKKEFNIYIIYTIKLEIYIYIYIYTVWLIIIQFGFMNSIFFFATFPSTQFVYI